MSKSSSTGVSVALSARRSLAAMALATVAVLIYEIAITRVLSVVLWYHFAFLSISVAMLGLGASGVWFSFRPRRDRSLRLALLTAGISIPLSVIVILKARPAIMAVGFGDGLWIGVVIVAMLVPMIGLGSAVCVLLLSAEGKSVTRMYAADLLGATVGAAFVIPLMAWIPTPELLALTGLLPLVGLAIVGGWRRAGWAVGSAAILIAVLWGTPFDVSYSKLYTEKGALVPLHEVWTPTARITVFDRPIFAPHPDFPWGWGYGTQFRPQATREYWIDQDGSAGTPIEQLTRDPSGLQHLLYDVTNFGYQLKPAKKVCVIGAGGGRDVLSALASGATDVIAVELNQAIVDLLAGPLAEFSGDPYRLPGVRGVVSEGRSFLTRTDEQFDLLQISLVDSWTATAAGAYSLSENYLYTVEALRLYLRRLTPDGLLSISRWTDQIQPLEGARIILLAEEALRQEGIEHPRDHLLFVSGGAVGTLIVGRRPFGAAQFARADEIARVRGFVRHWPPPPGGATNSLVSQVMQDGGSGIRQLTRRGFDLAPPVDDRPFFFQAANFFWGGAKEGDGLEGDVNLKSITILRTAVGVLGTITVLLFFLPFVLFRKPDRGERFWSGSFYFGLIGTGFMLNEIPWIQRSVLFVGHPSYAAAIVLGSILLGAGLGSLLAGRVPVAVGRRILLVLPVATAGLSLALGPVFTSSALAWSLPGRASVAALLFIVVGIPMGMALPTGFLVFGDDRKAWFWAVNGASGVFASAFSLAAAMSFGFLRTSLLGAACYLLALVALALPRTKT